jgi:hypothetical protein
MLFFGAIVLVACSEPSTAEIRPTRDEPAHDEPARDEPEPARGESAPGESGEPSQTSTTNEAPTATTHEAPPTATTNDVAPRAAIAETEQLGPTGWVYRERGVPVTVARNVGTRLAGERCGLRFAVVGAPRDTRCTETELDERLACMARERAAYSDWEIDPDDAEARARQRAIGRTQLVARAGGNEVAVEHPVWAIDCIDGLAVITEGPFEFTSHRAYVAIELRGDAIVQAREVSIDDAAEGQSDCANARDGVTLLPIVASSALVGAVVVGASGSPRFQLGVSEIGPSGVVDSFDTDLGARVAGYRVERTVLVAVPRTNALPERCPIVVADADGQTNLRPLPNTGRAPVGTLPNGTPIDPVEQRGRWYRIESPARGWVFAESLSRRCDGDP